MNVKTEVDLDHHHVTKINITLSFSIIHSSPPPSLLFSISIHWRVYQTTRHDCEVYVIMFIIQGWFAFALLLKFLIILNDLEDDFNFITLSWSSFRIALFVKSQSSCKGVIGCVEFLKYLSNRSAGGIIIYAFFDSNPMDLC